MEKRKKIVIFIDEVQYLDNPTSFLKYIYDNFENINFYRTQDKKENPDYNIYYPWEI